MNKITNNILFITLSNIGDVILALPVLDALRAGFPEAKITVMVGPRPKEIFENNPYINKLIVYDKRASMKENIRLFYALKKEDFDIVVDLRNSFLGAILPAKYKTSPFLAVPENIKHMRDRHLWRLQEVTRSYKRLQEVTDKKSLYISQQCEDYIKNILKENNISEEDKIVVISAGARSHIKRWPQDKFKELIPLLVEEFGLKIVLAGDKDDISISKYIREQLNYPIIDLTGKTTIIQLACVLKKAKLLVTNDSAVLHIGSYLNVPMVAIFGPTDELKYRPWSEKYAVVKKDIFCRPCQKAQCKFGTLECMQLIKVEDVLIQVKDILNPKSQIPNPKSQTNLPAVAGSRLFLNEDRDKSQIPKQYKRILIVRTDRIGDVLLSTPVIKALRENYPDAYIAMMVSPYAKDIVEGNPYLDTVIIYDKDGKHKSWQRSLKFARNLKKKRFDLALVLHPTNRAHLATFFAGIRQRIGYDRKMGFLLTHRIKHTKQLGERHELEYSLDLVRYLGIEPKDKNLFMPIKNESEKWVADIFEQEGISSDDKLLAIHPGASCPSKIWPNERFAQVSDELAEKYKFKVLLVAGPKDIALAQNVIKNMRNPAINLAGKTSVSELASVLKRCQLFISNDSGPVHIASAVGVAVISIFGRNLKGLSPMRWGPVGKKDKVLHKEVGCSECLAHNCTRDFACLKAITVEEVLSTADSVLT